MATEEVMMDTRLSGSRSRENHSEIAMGTTDLYRRRLIPLRIQRMRMGLDHYHPIMRRLMEMPYLEMPYQESSSDSDDKKKRKFCYRRRNRNPNPNPIKIPVSMDEDSSSEEDEDSSDEAEIPEEQSKLSIRIMDWSRVSAKDLLLLLNPFLPEDGRILSVAVYPKDGHDGYHAVAKCDSTATAEYLCNKSRHGIESEFERCSNKLLDFRCIPDYLEFIQPACDVATHEPDPLVQGVRLMHIDQL